MVLRTCVGLIALLAFGTAWGAQNAPPIRFGLTPVIIHNQQKLLTDWRVYLQKKLGRPVEFVSRDSYRENIDLFKQKKIDFAWVSDYSLIYLDDRHLARLLVTPLYRGRPYYSSYLIVPTSDFETKSLLQLKGKIFAYADPYSNSGHLVPRYQLQLAGEDPNHFFRKTFFTWGHRRIVDAVAQGLAEGGSLDSYVWDTLSVIQPELTHQTRIVIKSPEYGFPPIVVRRTVSRSDSAAMQHALLDMATDPDGAKVLKQLNLSGFAIGDAKLYGGVRQMMRSMDDL